eukprot:2937304-Rhodomonas_salina.2
MAGVVAASRTTEQAAEQCSAGLRAKGHVKGHAGRGGTRSEGSDGESESEGARWCGWRVHRRQGAEEGASSQDRLREGEEGGRQIHSKNMAV